MIQLSRAQNILSVALADLTTTMRIVYDMARTGYVYE